VVVDWSLLCGKRPHAWPEEGCLVTEPGGLVRWQPAKEARSLLSAHPAYRWGYMQRRLSVTKNEKQSEQIAAPPRWRKAPVCPSRMVRARRKTPPCAPDARGP